MAIENGPLDVGPEDLDTIDHNSSNTSNETPETSPTDVRGPDDGDELG